MLHVVYLSAKLIQSINFLKCAGAVCGVQIYVQCEITMNFFNSCYICGLWEGILQRYSVWLHHIPYTWVNKHIRLFPKLQGNIRLTPLIMKGKIDHTPKPPHLFGSTHVHTWQRTRQVKRTRKLSVNLMLTVESPISVSCDAMTNVGSWLNENSWCTCRWKVES